MPAPATEPWFMPRLNPAGPLTWRSTVIAICVSAASSVVSSDVRSV